MTENLRIWESYVLEHDVPNKILLRTEDEIKLFLNVILPQVGSGLRSTLSRALACNFKGYAPLPWVIGKPFDVHTIPVSDISDKALAREYYAKAYESTDNYDVVTLPFVLKAIIEHNSVSFNPP